MVLRRRRRDDDRRLRAAGYYHAGASYQLPALLLGLDWYRFEPQYGTILLPYGTPENTWPLAFAWPAPWFNGYYQIVGNADAAANRQGPRFSARYETPAFDVRTEYAVYSTVGGVNLTTASGPGFVDAYFPVQLSFAHSTPGQVQHAAAYAVWHSGPVDVAFDLDDDTEHRSALPPGGFAGYVTMDEPQAILTLSHQFSAWFLLAAGIGRYALRGNYGVGPQVNADLPRGSPSQALSSGQPSAWSSWSPGEGTTRPASRSFRGPRTPPTTARRCSSNNAYVSSRRRGVHGKFEGSRVSLLPAARPGFARLEVFPQVKIVVTVKLVPDTNADKRIDPATKRLVRSGVETVLNPFDEYAIEAALQLKEKRNDGSTVTIFTMAPESGKEIVRKALAMGADDAVMLSDAGLAGSDVWGTAYAMAAALKKGGFDLVLCGTQSTDANTGEVPGMLAEYLGVPGITYLRTFVVEDGVVRGERETETGYQKVSAKLPALISITKSIHEPRYPSLKASWARRKSRSRSCRSRIWARSKPSEPTARKLKSLTLPRRRCAEGASGHRRRRRRRRADHRRIFERKEVSVMHNVIAFIEHKHGQPRRVSLEIASKAKELADALGGKAHAVVVGGGATALAEIFLVCCFVLTD